MLLLLLLQNLAFEEYTYKFIESMHYGSDNSEWKMWFFDQWPCVVVISIEGKDTIKYKVVSNSLNYIKQYTPHSESLNHPQFNA